MAQQLALPFEARAALGRSDFIVAPSNAQAVAFVDRWPDWPSPAALIGPSGCGKTHLATVWMARSGAERMSAAALSAEWVAALSDSVPVIVEDVDAVPPTSERDRALFRLFERPANTLLLTARTPPEDWPAEMGDLRSRFAAVLAFPMWAPDDVLLENLTRKLFADRQLDVADAVIRRILRAAERTPAAISAFVAEADRKALAERRGVTERLVTALLDTMETKQGEGSDRP